MKETVSTDSSATLSANVLQIGWVSYVTYRTLASVSFSFHSADLWLPLDSVLVPCTANPCLNGASCMVDGTTFSCSCLAGFSGTPCQTQLPAYFSNPCANGATCSDYGQLNSFTCSCVPGENCPSWTDLYLSSKGLHVCMYYHSSPLRIHWSILWKEHWWLHWEQPMSEWRDLRRSHPRHTVRQRL